MRKGKSSRTLDTGREVCGKQSTPKCEILVVVVYTRKKMPNSKATSTNEECPPATAVSLGLKFIYYFCFHYCLC